MIDEQIRDVHFKTTGGAAPIGSLSGGNQQKVVIGKMLTTNPSVLLLDDPSRGIDLSVSLTLGLSGIVAGFLMQGVRLEPLGIIRYLPPWVVALLSCTLGALVGLTNGVLVARFRAPPFVATLGVMYMVRGVALLITSGLIYNNPSGKPELGNTGFNRLAGVPIGVWAMIVVALVLHLVVARAAFGRWL